jgi:hypothetical protein
MDPAQDVEDEHTNSSESKPPKARLRNRTWYLSVPLPLIGRSWDGKPTGKDHYIDVHPPRHAIAFEDTTTCNSHDDA